MNTAIIGRFPCLAFLLLPFFLSQLAAAQTTKGQEDTSYPGEISVTAEEQYFPTLSSVRITLSLEATGATAEAAAQSLEVAAGKVKEAAKSVSAPCLATTRHESFQSAAEQGGPITSGTAVRVKRSLSIETAETAKAGKLIDTLLRSGATAITQTEFMSSGNDKIHLEAVQRATEKAKAKAAMIAASLGGKLGALLSAGVSEEPPPLTLRDGMEQSLDFLGGNGRDTTVSVTLRFEVAH